LLTLIIAALLGIVPLAGIAWILLTHSITSVDGLFMTLILLSLSSVFFLNLFLELRERGVLGKAHAGPAKAGPAPKSE
jgi:hypothetical protein